MSKKKPRTTGTEWLFKSMAAFNGSGFADRTDAEAFYESYVLYKLWKNLLPDAHLAETHKLEALSFAEHLVLAKGPGHTPSPKALQNFQDFSVSQQSSLF